MNQHLFAIGAPNKGTGRTDLKDQTITQKGTPSKRDLDALQAAVLRRYGSDLFHLHGASDWTLYRFGQTRLLVSLTHWLAGLFYSVISRHPPRGSAVGIAGTTNQRRSLEALKRTIMPDLTIVRFNQIGVGRTLMMLLLTLVACITFPALFIFSAQREAAHALALLKPRAKIMFGFYRSLSAAPLVVSNDHQTEIFWGSYLLARSGASVAYVQHGAVKPEFPRNFFHQVFVRDERSRQIYAEHLCARPDAQVMVFADLEAQAAPASAQSQGYQGLLVALSHQFAPSETRRILRALRAHLPDEPVSLRFHPSDSLATLKFAIASWGLANIHHDRSTEPFPVVFRRSRLTVAAASSILVEAIEIDSQRVVWIRSLGLPWDYYALADHVQVFDTVSDFERSPLFCEKRFL